MEISFPYSDIITYFSDIMQWFFLRILYIIENEKVRLRGSIPFKPNNRRNYFCFRGGGKNRFLILF